MRAPSNRGFTLIELLVTAGIAIVLLLAVVPLIGDWVYSAQTRDARAKLVQAFGTAKALALRNAAGAATPAGAAGLVVVTGNPDTTVLVCSGSSAAAGCAVGGANVKWSATYPATIVTTVNSVTGAAGTPLAIDIDNRGTPSTGTSFALTRGGSANNESGTLY